MDDSAAAAAPETYPPPWRWNRVATHDGRAAALILETEHRPVPHNDPVILAVREDWIHHLLLHPQGKAHAELLRRAPALESDLAAAIVRINGLEHELTAAREARKEAEAARQQGWNIANALRGRMQQIAERASAGDTNVHRLGRIAREALETARELGKSHARGI